MRVPRSAGILRCHDEGGNVASHLDSVNGTVAQHAVQVMSTKACAMQEDNECRGFLTEVIVLRGINPEVITVLDNPLLGREQIVLSICADNNGQQQKYG